MLQETSKNSNSSKFKPYVDSKFVKSLGLKYSMDTEPGIYRLRKGKDFIFKDESGKIIKSSSTLERIRKLVIPPAWENVWINKDPNGHIQATGRDARGRKQYKYHTDWSTARNIVKFDKLEKFGEGLCKLRKKIKADLKLPGMPKEKILATVLNIMEATHFRVGNDIYTKQNKSFGLTTIRNHHVKIQGAKAHFNFRGKSGVQRTGTLDDPRITKIIKRCQELPGQELFAYVDDEGKVQDITSTDVNEYIRNHSTDELSAKDFRTWGASVKAIEILLEKEQDVPSLSETAWKKHQCEIIKETAKALGNTVAVCRKYYVHPKVFEAARDGSLYKKNLLKKNYPGLLKAETILVNLIK